MQVPSLNIEKYNLLNGNGTARFIVVPFNGRGQKPFLIVCDKQINIRIFVTSTSRQADVCAALSR